MVKNKKIPSDLGLDMGTKEHSIWETVAKNCKVAIDNCEKELFIQKAILELAEKNIQIEKEKFKA
jgi:hypothetical protein